MWAWSLIWTTLSPDELSTQDHSPYSMVMGIEGGSRWTRCSIGLLAQPRDSDMARKPTSPLGWGEEMKKVVRDCGHYVVLFKMWVCEGNVGLPWGLCVTVVDVLSHCVIIKEIFEFPFEIRTESVHQARTWIIDILWSKWTEYYVAQKTIRHNNGMSYPMGLPL